MLIHEEDRSGSGRVPGRARRAARLPLVLVAAAALTSGCTTTVQRGFLPTSSDTTDQTDRIMRLWNGSWIAALAVGVLVWGLIIWCVVAYRRRRDEAGLPAQLRYNVPLEILYTVVPLMMVAVLFYYTARDQAAIQDVSRQDDVKINVVGKQWAWDFNYLEQGGQPLDVYETGVQVQLTGQPGAEDQAPVLYLPVNQRVEFSLTSRDVIHSFWIPAFLYKMDVIPGVDNRFEVTPTRIGEYRGKCAELCGEYHTEMHYKVRVVSQQDFAAHIEELRQRGQTGRLDTNLGRSRTPEDRPGGAVPGARPGGNDGTGSN